MKLEILGKLMDTPRFFPAAVYKHLGLILPRLAWVPLNLLQNGIGQFLSYMHKCGLASSPIFIACKNEQTADHIILIGTPTELKDLAVSDQDTRKLFKNINASF